MKHKIFWYIPEKLESSEQIMEDIVQGIKDDGRIEICGAYTEGYLREGLIDKLEGAEWQDYPEVTPEVKKEIENEILEAFEVANETLEIPIEQLVYIFPWQDNLPECGMGGITGMAQYSCVFHVYVDFRGFSMKDLRDTIIHELNHTIYYYRNYDRMGEYSLLENIVMEGLAEHFREEVLGGEHAPWAVALEEEEAFTMAKTLAPDWDSTDWSGPIREAIFGYGKFPKWFGYTLGYWLVKRMRERNPQMKWDELMDVSMEEYRNML